MKLLRSLLKRIAVVRDLHYLNDLVGQHGATSYCKYIAINYFPWTVFKLLFKSPSGDERYIYFPLHRNSEAWGNIFVGINTRLSRPGCYFQGGGKLFIGDYVGIAPNCAVISSNHGINNQDERVNRETIIGDHCWLGFGCSVMAGVVLGPRTVVGAGSVVTHSFPEGFVVLAGSPAKVIKHLSKEDFVPRHRDYALYGYIPERHFDKYFRKHLSYIKFDYDLTSVSQNKYAALLSNTIKEDSERNEYYMLSNVNGGGKSFNSNDVATINISRKEGYNIAA